MCYNRITYIYVKNAFKLNSHLNKQILLTGHEYEMKLVLKKNCRFKQSKL